MDFEATAGSIVPLAQAMASPASKFQTVKVQGTGAIKTDFALPYDGAELRGQELESQCDQWAEVGTMEPDCAAALKAGARKLGELKGRTFLILGAGSELGPARPLLEAGATVVAVATRRSQRWADLIAFARGTAGTLLIPVAGQAGQAWQVPGSDEELAKSAGADLLAEAPAVSEWLVRCGRVAPGLVTLGTYLYADGEANMRLTAAADFVVEALAKALGNQKVSFAYLASSSTAVVIPPEAVQAQADNYAQANNWAKLCGTRRNCAPLEGSSVPLHIYRGIEVLQGPNYALSQSMRQWRAVLLHMEGFVVSAPVAPNCRTESVLHNKTMAVILEGVGYWAPMESFDADTARMAMYAILISDLSEKPPQLASPMHLFARKSFHSGGWRCPFELSSLGMTTWVLGKLAPRKRPKH
ncbi:unnamed protein product [Polarella glacialis]|uniref:Uncharacterized protein n=1 Tax=Polarella glacialis TaxID=89957 RepID=A0A813LNE3_POLGL|nr:unnamed protein product [Polarella glacialis]